LFDVIAECGFTGHAYVDDIQVYINTPVVVVYSDAMDRLTKCITQIRDWMASNCLKLNEDKTQIIWLGTCQQLDKVTVQALRLLNATVPFSTVINDLGVQLNSQLTMADHIAALSLILLLPPATAQIDHHHYHHHHNGLAMAPLNRSSA